VQVSVLRSAARRRLVKMENPSACETVNWKMKKAVFWDVAPCIYGVNRRFGGTYRLHLQGRREIIRKSTREASVRDVSLPLTSLTDASRVDFVIISLLP
jgi:hypothetical protein